MKISVDQQEIEAAIVAFVGKQGVPLDGKKIKIAITAGRGANGLSAEIDITNGKTPKNTKAAAPVVEDPPFDEPTTTVETAEEEPVIEETPVTEEDEAGDEEKPLFGGGD